MKWAGPSYRRPLASDRYPEAVPGEWPFFHAKGHGTKVLSKITGKKYGVIKRPSAVVVVRYPLYTLLEDLLDMVTWVIQDWQDHRDETIVKVTEMNIALGFRLDQLEEEDILKLPQLESRLVEAMNEGILPIVSAGNRGGPVYKYPALFPAPRDLNGQVRVPPAAGIMVIGSTNNYGKKSTFSCTAEWVQLTAPGEDIMMAQSSGSGTSFSTAGTTGIGAYLSALGDYADDQSGTWASRTQALRTELMTFAYPRTCGNLDEYPLGVWNKVTEVNGVPGTWEPTNAQKRDIVDDVCTYVDPVSSATSSATSSTRVVASLSPSPSSPTTQKAQYHTTVKSHQSSLILGFNASSYLGALGSYLKENCLVTASNCSEGGQISDVYSYDGENLVKGTIDIAIPFSQWQNANQLYAMQLIAVKAASSSESNCQVYDKQDGSCFGRRTDLGGIPCENEPVQVCHFTNATEVVVNDFNDGVVGQLVSLY